MRVARGIEEFHMTYASQLQEVDGVGMSTRRESVPTGEMDGHDLVFGSVDEELAYAEREQRYGGCCGIQGGILIG
jgi:hypothetical protein